MADDCALAGPRLIFHKPPPKVRLHTPHTPNDAHTRQCRIVREADGAALLLFGDGQWAACDDFHWTGFWPKPADAVEALRKLREDNKPRIVEWKRTVARAKLTNIIDVKFPGARAAASAVADGFQAAATAWNKPAS